MRAFRYCQHDCGHAIAAVSYAAAALGWHTTMLDAAADDEVAALLGVDRGGDYTMSSGLTSTALTRLRRSLARRPIIGQPGPPRSTFPCHASTLLLRLSTDSGAAQSTSMA